MIGYLFAILAGLLLLVFAGLAVTATGRRRRRPAHDPTFQEPVDADRPASEEPTPDRSVTATPAQVAAARRHTPPS